MKLFWTSSFILSFIVFLIFRLIWLITTGTNKDGNFLILTLIPLTISVLLIYLVKIIFHYIKKANH